MKATKLLAAASLLAAITTGLPETASARVIKESPMVSASDADLAGLLYRIDNIIDTDDSDDAVVLAFWLAGANTEEIVTALCIRHHETNPRYFGSGLGVKSRTNDWGPMQINRPTWEGVALQMGYDWYNVSWNPWANAQVAVEIWWRHGYSFKAWTTYKYCH